MERLLIQNITQCLNNTLRSRSLCYYFNKCHVSTMSRDLTWSACKPCDGSDRPPSEQEHPSIQRAIQMEAPAFQSPAVTEAWEEQFGNDKADWLTGTNIETECLNPC